MADTKSTNPSSDIATLCKEIKAYTSPYLTYESPHFKLEKILQDAGYTRDESFHIRRRGNNFEYLFQNGICPKIPGTYYLSTPHSQFQDFVNTVENANIKYGADMFANQAFLTIASSFSFSLITSIILYNPHRSIIDQPSREPKIAFLVGLGLGALYHPVGAALISGLARRKIRKKYLPQAYFKKESLDPEIIRIALEGRAQE